MCFHLFYEQAEKNKLFRTSVKKFISGY